MNRKAFHSMRDGYRGSDWRRRKKRYAAVDAAGMAGSKNLLPLSRVLEKPLGNEQCEPPTVLAVGV
jgi:hypothetical protein